VTTSKARSVLILGANPETAGIVEIAKSMGLRAIVSNPFFDSPAKKIADKAYNVDPRIAEEIDSIIQAENIDAIVLGVSDPLLLIYTELCSKYDFFCYAGKKSVEAFSSKASFAKSIENFGVKTTPQYGLFKDEEEAAKIVELPVVVKPVDAGAATGVSLCSTPNDLKLGIRYALDASIKKEVIVEKAMFCDDMMAYYTFRNGKVFLTALADREKSKKQGLLPKVCLVANYPSRHTKKFLVDVHPKLKKYFEHLEIKNGVLSIQFFYDGSEFYAYDPGFRIQGEAPHVYVQELFGVNQRKGLIEFSLTNSFLTNEFEDVVDVYFNGKFARTLWVLGGLGKISSIRGLSEISRIHGVLAINQRLGEGEVITKEMIGTEKQVIMRIHTLSSSLMGLDSITRDISKVLRIEDQEGSSLIEDLFDGSSQNVE
jgi:biotin carboxylase